MPIVAASLVASCLMIALMLLGSDPLDWRVYEVAVARYGQPDLYDSVLGAASYRYSPVAIYPLSVLTLMPEELWRALHIAALFLLPYPMIGLVAFPFWFDVHAGNLVTFIVVAAYWALRGNRWATGILLTLTLLIPRPMMVPLVLWVLWKRPEWRVPFVALFVVHAAAVVATGYADEWVSGLLSAGSEVDGKVNIGPTQLIGYWWLLAALPLAGWAFWRGYPATAGLLVQPYWLPYYLLLPLADARRFDGCRSDSQGRSCRQPSRPARRPTFAAPLPRSSPQPRTGPGRS